MKRKMLLFIAGALALGLAGCADTAEETCIGGLKCGNTGLEWQSCCKGGDCEYRTGDRTFQTALELQQYCGTTDTPL